MSDPSNQINYGPVYYSFTLQIEVSSDSSVGVPANVTVLVPLGLMAGTILWQNQELNVTGQFVTSQPSQNSPPVGSFMVSSLNIPANSPAWMQTLKTLIGDITTIGKALVTLVVQLVQNFFHISLPPYTVGLIMVLLLSIFLIKWFTKLPWILVLVGIFVLIAMFWYSLSSLIP
jgi:hypothetical protein